MDTHRSKIIKTLTTIIAIVIIAVLANLYQISAEDAVINSTLSEMKEIGKYQEFAFENQLSETKSDLLLLANFISISNIPNDEIIEFLNQQSQSQQFESLFYVHPSGIGISTENEKRNFSHNESFQHALNGEFYITAPYKSPDNEEIIFDVCVPVIKNNQVVAVLSSGVSINDFIDSYNIKTAGKGDIFIVDQELNFIYSSSAGHIGYAVIPEGDVMEMGLENVQKAREDILASENGGFYYDYYGTDKVMVYMPIAMTNWALAMNVECSLINLELSNAVEQLTIICQSIYWFLILLILYTWFTQARTLKRLEKTAFYDKLTELPNMEKLKQVMRNTLEHNKTDEYSLVIFDIEKFKVFNEMYGHDMGDKILKTMKLLEDVFDEPTLTIARAGSDTFAMFSGNNFLDDMQPLLAKGLDFYEHAIPELINHTVTFKFGRYKIQPYETDVDDIISKVNFAHKKAKETEGLDLCDYDNIFKTELLKKVDITNKMNSALKNDEFIIYLQPKFGINDDTLIGAEALVRWLEADGTMIYPNDFIPLFEQNGFIVELDKYVLNKTCLAIRKWIDEDFGAITISVNLSRVNLRNPKIAEDILQIVDSHNIPHEYIEIELTESASEEQEDALEILYSKLHSFGFKTSIDDFGAGYSSLAMLKNLSVNTLKMDRSFFIGGKSIRRDDMLIDGIVKLSHSLGMYVVAEGIETAEQIETLKSMNCDAVQGYFYDKPMPVDTFEEKYRKLMPKKLIKAETLPLVQGINDTKYASSFVPCGIVVAETDEYFTIKEANDGYFNIIGLSRNEFRDMHQNRGLYTLHEDDRQKTLDYFANSMEKDKNASLGIVCRVKLKNSEYLTVQLSGRVSKNEQGQQRIYFTVTDINSYTQTIKALNKEREFNYTIASLTNNAFFDYNLSNKTIRFSKNFADKFSIPDIISDFTQSDIARTMFPKCVEVLTNISLDMPYNAEGEFCVIHNGSPIWYIYSCKLIFDNEEQRHKVVGKMSEVLGHRLEMDLLKVKSEETPDSRVYNKSSTDRYIHNYLRIISSEHDTGAFFAIKLENFDKMKLKFGQEFAQDSLSDIGHILRDMFRSSDIIGRTGENTFYVFINNHKSDDFAKRKAEELYHKLTRTYEKDGEYLEVSANIGISLYPEHGDEFVTLYEKATKALHYHEKIDNLNFSIHEEKEVQK